MIKLEGTDFQIAVWKELLKIPAGSTKTYKEIAGAIGKPNSSRAVANACAQNPYAPAKFPATELLDLMVHLGGYSADGGMERKRQLLEMEST